MCGNVEAAQIVRRINKDPINRIAVDIIGGYIFQIDFIDFRAVSHVMGIRGGAMT